MAGAGPLYSCHMNMRLADYSGHNGVLLIEVIPTYKICLSEIGQAPKVEVEYHKVVKPFRCRT